MIPSEAKPGTEHVAFRCPLTPSLWSPSCVCATLEHDPAPAQFSPHLTVSLSTTFQPRWPIFVFQKQLVTGFLYLLVSV